MSTSNKISKKGTGKQDLQIEQQVEYVKLLQGKINTLLQECEGKEFLRILMKLNNEVALARLELERAVKSNLHIERKQKRVKWLEKRIKNFLFMSRAMCHVEYHGKSHEQNGSKIHKSDLSENFIEHLTAEQKQRLFPIENDSNEDTDSFMNTKEQVENGIEKIFSLTTICDDTSISSEDEGQTGSLTDRVEEVNTHEENPGFIDTQQNSMTSMTSSMVDYYWNSDHHRFEWTNFMQKQDPLSWHALAISYPDTFLKQGMSKFKSNEIPWRVERDLSEGSEFTKKSIELVHQKLQALLQAIEDAAVNSVKLENASDEPQRSVRGRRDFQKAAGEWKESGENLPPLMQTRSLDYYDERVNKLFSRPVSVVLPVVNKSSSKQYPRNSKHWCDLDKVDIPRHTSYLRGPKQKLKEVATITKKKPLMITSRTEESTVSLRKAASKIRALTRLKPSRESVHDLDDLKWKRVLELLGNCGIKSENLETAKDAFKTLSQLDMSHTKVIEAVCNRIQDETNPDVIYEACKCLIKLGSWESSAVRALWKGLKKGKKDLQLDILSTISSAKNAQFVSKETEEIEKLIDTLSTLASSSDDDIALGASLSLGHLCVADSAARQHLFSRLEDTSFAIRAKALESLVRQMNCKDDVIIDCLLFQISNARNWKQRISAAELLQYIGVKDATKEDPDKVFDTLEKLLWNHPSTELRAKIADVIADFGMRPKAIFLVHKRLDDLNESIRTNAIQMLSSLRMKGEKELRILLDILELDSSVNVRLQVLQAFDALKWSDLRVIRTLQDREKGDGTLAKKAAVVLQSLVQ
ncbi:uncharacterized protein LOC135692046 isoform X2 [Rhopilema esculentum]|uniref:uncharacterized protein LOC135692046 isoform X2 n=1 Tax=Rhopilema esculentum TaxID=499914 RepID=UPI0031DD4DF4